jgi:hypothetical protein
MKTGNSPLFDNAEKAYWLLRSVSKQSSNFENFQNTFNKRDIHKLLQDTYEAIIRANKIGRHRCMILG